MAVVFLSSASNASSCHIQAQGLVSLFVISKRKRDNATPLCLQHAHLSNHKRSSLSLPPSLIQSRNADATDGSWDAPRKDKYVQKRRHRACKFVNSLPQVHVHARANRQRQCASSDFSVIMCHCCSAPAQKRAALPAVTAKEVVPFTSPRVQLLSCVVRNSLQKSRVALLVLRVWDALSMSMQLYATMRCDESQTLVCLFLRLPAFVWTVFIWLWHRLLKTLFPPTTSRALSSQRFM